MIILDTDHFTILRYSEDSRYRLLTQRLLTSEDEHIVTTVVTVEEQMRGWLAEINRWRDIRRQLPAYKRLARLIEFLSHWEIALRDPAKAYLWRLSGRNRLSVLSPT
jgi:tRNA(fMet)-specific endonuclease VapC